MTDPAGAGFSYVYDDSANLSSVTYPDASIRTYHYEESSTAFANALTGITDENGVRFATWSYLEPDAGGRNPSRPISSVHAGGAEQYSAQYNSSAFFNWDSTAITDPLGVTRTYTYGTFGGRRRTTSIVGPPCGSCGPPSASYDTNGYAISVTDWNGNTTSYTRADPSGRHELETARTEAAGSNVARTVTTQWHPTLRLPVRIAEPKRITTLTYDEHGNLTARTIQPTGDATGAQAFGATATGPARTWTWSYVFSTTVPGLIQQITADGPRTDVADVTVYQYYSADASCVPSAADGSVIGCRGQLASITNARGHVTQFARYNAHGQPEQVIDPNGLPVTLSYDVRQRLTGLEVGGEFTRYEYFPTGLLKQATRPDASFLAFTYDDAHRLTQIVDNAGNSIVYTLDAMGNHTQEQVYDPANVLKRTRARIYSNLNRLIQEVGGSHPATQITRYGYDSQGNVTSITDPLGHLNGNAYDALNRLMRSIDPAATISGVGGTTKYDYDGTDQLTQVTGARNLATGYTLDGLGNLTRLASPDTGSDESGRSTRRTEAFRKRSLPTSLMSLSARRRAFHSAMPKPSVASST
jgi:YD repeat-containing protein